MNLLTTYFLLSFFFFTNCVFNQEINSDTTYSYFDSGKTESKIFINNDGRKESLIYYENGSLKMRMVFNSDGHGIYESEYKDSLGLTLRIRLRKNNSIITKSYFENGNILSEGFQNYEKYNFTQYWESGKIRVKVNGRNGISSLTLIRHKLKDFYPKEDSVKSWSDIGWVYAMDSIWVDSLGRDIFNNYTQTKIEYFENGKKKRVEKIERGSKNIYILEWNEKGELIREEYEKWYRIIGTRK